MSTLDLEFRFDLLGLTPRDFAGALSIDQLKATVGGLVGALGYRVDAPAPVSGTVVRTTSGEVVINGTLQASLAFDCVRCLQPRVLDVEVSGQQVLVKQSRKPAIDSDEPIELDQDALDQPDEYAFDGETVKLADVYCEELVLMVSMNPQCIDAGEPECAAPAQEPLPPEASIDPRWAPLLALKQKLAGSDSSDSSDSDSSDSDSSGSDSDSDAGADQ